MNGSLVAIIRLIITNLILPERVAVFHTNNIPAVIIVQCIIYVADGAT